jgi:hypothetical protein
MKVFIAHSSTDRWIARRISQDLIALGVTTFLDEKDIETGDSIDEAIHKHLTECDELLILLSPAALKSHWVLVEIGGGRALEKRLVPIMLQIGPNDLPAPISKGLARDLNEIEKYYEEVKARVAGTAQPAQTSVRTTTQATRRAVASARTRRTFKVGDVVRIPEQPQSNFNGTKGLVRWKGEMDAFLGRTGTVTYADDDRTVILDTTGGWWWAMDWLEPAG